MDSIWVLLDSPELWKSIAFCISVVLIAVPFYRFLIKWVRVRASQIASNLNEALTLRRQAEDLLRQAQSKNFHKDTERKKIVRQALTQARILKESAGEQMQQRLSDKTQEVVERVHLIRQTGLQELKEKVVSIAVDTTSDILENSSKTSQQDAFMEVSLRDLEWLLKQKEQKNQLLQAVSDK